LIVSSGGSFGNRNSIEGMNSIWNARDIGIGSIVCYYYFFTKKNNYNIKLIGLPVMLVLLAGMLFNASRGPIAALSSAILFLELSSFTKIKNQYFKGLKFTYLMLLSIIILVTAFSTSSRLNISYMIDDKNVQDRVKLYSSSFEIVTTKPIFGTGIGGFSVAYKGNDARIYTHNFLLEILIELGIVGLLFTLVIFRFFIRDRKLLLSNDSGVVWTAFFIFFLVNAMFSGDLFGNAIMWLPGAGMIKVKESLIMKKEEMKKNRNLNLRQYTER
jgi:O-antigen ligase